MRNAASIAAGASCGSIRRAATSESMTRLKLMSPRLRVTGSISTKTRLTAGSCQSSVGREPPVEPHEPGDGHQHLDHRPDEDAAGVDVELRRLRVGLGNADHERDDDGDIPEDRCERRDREALVAVEDADDDPRDAQQRHRGEQDAGEPDDEVLLLPLVAEGLHQPGREEDEERRQGGEPEREQEQEAGRDAPGARLLSLCEQLAEDRDEGGAEREVGHERTHEVRHLIGDGERVDPTLDAEVAPHHDLADEPDDPRDAGQEREDRGRPSESRARAQLLDPDVRHPPSIGTAPTGSARAAAPGSSVAPWRRPAAERQALDPGC